MPALFAVVFFAACSNEENMDFKTVDVGLPQPLIEIYEPLDGGVIPADTEFVVDYGVVRGQRGRYVEIIVDGQESERVNSLKSRHRMQGLPAGGHTLEIVERAANGQPTGGVAKIEFIAN